MFDRSDDRRHVCGDPPEDPSTPAVGDPSVSESMHAAEEPGKGFTGRKGCGPVKKPPKGPMDDRPSDPGGPRTPRKEESGTDPEDDDDTDTDSGDTDTDSDNDCFPDRPYDPR